jgi:hypothetical protein
MSALDQIANFAKATVSVGYGLAATSIVLASGQGARFPAASAGAYNLVYWNATDFPDPSDDPAVEIVRVTHGGGSDGDTLTIVRAQEGTLASNKLNLNKIYKMQLALTAKMIADIAANFSGTIGLKFIQVTGAVPGTIFTLASTFVGKSVIIQNNTFFYQDVDYTVSGLNITWSYTLSDDYTSPLTLICVG